MNPRTTADEPENRSADEPDGILGRMNEIHWRADEPESCSADEPENHRG
jgi:hypothetical protein